MMFAEPEVTFSNPKRLTPVFKLKQEELITFVKNFISISKKKKVLKGALKYYYQD